MKNSSRRSFLKKTALAISIPTIGFATADYKMFEEENTEKIDAALAKSVLKKELFPNPIILETVELLHYDGNYICRVRSKEGAEGICVSNNMQMQYLYPIFTKRIQPFFIGKDARNLEQLLEEVYVYKSNYKLQNLAI